MEAAGLKPSVGYKYLSHMTGGDEAVGYELRDQINFVGRLRMKDIEGGDARKVIEVLEEKSKTQEGFFYRALRSDSEEKNLLALYWRDSMMKEDYDIYGDCVILDTTFRTNRYNLICAIIVGMNNHGSNCMLACAFLSDEKTETFEWLLRTFRKSMGGKAPITIFTDQDKAMAKAIKKVLFLLQFINSNVDMLSDKNVSF